MVNPHVVIFPLPFQGPVNCMLKLAELLCLDPVLRVTFINSEYIQQRLRDHTHVEARFKKYPNFHFVTLPDGLPEDNPRAGDEIVKLLEGVDDVSSPLFREMVTSGSIGPVTCLIVDALFTFAVNIAKEANVPLIYFDTSSPCGLWTYLCVPKLIQAGEIPFKGDELDTLVNSVPGMEGLIRRRDLPGFCREADLAADPITRRIMEEGKHIFQAQALIFNTFEALEGPVLSQFRAHCPNIYALGPLHLHLRRRLTTSSSSRSNSLLKEDTTCMDWLEEQEERSVVFISMGSLATMSKDQLMEFWYGLVNSKARFLWVQRPGSITGLEGDDNNNNNIPAELLEATKERGCIVSWAPQEKVLGHPSVGAFLTHCGWNSTLESIVEGVPMICWPYFVDQQVNSRFVGEVWKIGLDMKDICDRGVVESMVKQLMELRRFEFLERAKEMATLALQSVTEGGTSFLDFNRLVEDIKLMRV